MRAHREAVNAYPLCVSNGHYVNASNKLICRKGILLAAPLLAE